MEYLLLLVLVVLWIVLRSRDREKQYRFDTELLERLEQIQARLRALETARATSSQLGALKPETPPVEGTAPVAETEQSPKEEAHVAAQVEIPPFVPAAAEERSEQPLAEGVEVFSAHRFSSHRAEPAQAQPGVEQTEPQREPRVPARAASIEERLGSNWLNKLGIVILVFGVAFFLAYQLKNLGPAGKVVTGFAVCATLLAGGLVLERRSNYRIFAWAGIGGGWALTFFTTYAMYHVDATRVLTSQMADLVLMFLVAAGMVWHSLRYRSQVVTGLAFLLAFSTVTISQVTTFSLLASALLAAGLVFVTSREHWAELELAGLVAVFLNHFLWLDHALQANGGPGHPFPEFFSSAGLILLYWAIFRAAYVLRVPRDRREDVLTSITAVLNSAGVLGLLKYQSAHPEWAFWALLVLGAAEMLLAFLARAKRRTAFIVLSSVASSLLVAAIPFRFRGSPWSVLWVLEGEVLFVSGVRMREAVFRRLGMLAGFAAACQLAVGEWAPILSLRAAHADAGRHWSAALALGCAAAAYWFNAVAAPRRWNEVSAVEADFIALRVMSYLGLAAAMAGLWVFFPESQTAIAWMVLVLVLGFAADGLDSGDLALQADLLAAAALVRVFLVNLFVSGPFVFGHRGFLSERAVTVGVVAALFYLGMRRKRGPANLDGGDIPAVYSWAGSVLMAVLMWYELRPVSVAVGWMVLALVLLEIGVLSKRVYLRQQAVLLLAASFVRIFFANLNAGGTEPLLNPRNYTVVPLIAAYFWTYERLKTGSGKGFERVAGSVVCWFGTVTLAALLYFDVRPEWVAIVWAVLVFALLAAAWMTGRQLFLGQGLVLALAVFLRALLFNLFSGTPAQSGFMERPGVCIGLAAGILFLTLPLAFRLRRRDAENGSAQRKMSWIEMVLSRPEQLLFFAPLVLVTVMLAHEMRAGMITVAWSALGVGIFLLALLVRERSYRLAGLGLLLLGVGKILLIDIWKLAPTDRYITLIVTGIALLLVSFLYTRYREVILKFL